jgi:hypothetical protein
MKVARELRKCGLPATRKCDAILEINISNGKSKPYIRAYTHQEGNPDG